MGSGYVAVVTSTMTCSSPWPPAGSRSLSVLVIGSAPELRARLVRLVTETPLARVAGEAACGEEAFTAARAAQPDALLVDVGGCGPELGLVAQLRRLTPRCTIVALGGGVGVETHDACIRRGADFYFMLASQWDLLAEVLAGLAESHASW